MTGNGSASPVADQHDLSRDSEDCFYGLLDSGFQCYLYSLPVRNGRLTDKIRKLLKVRAKIYHDSYLRRASTCLKRGARSIGLRCPTVATACAPTTFPMNPTTSVGIFLATQGPVTERKASPAPIRSTTRPAKAGISKKPSSLL